MMIPEMFADAKCTAIHFIFWIQIIFNIYQSNSCWMLFVFKLQISSKKQFKNQCELFKSTSFFK